MESNLSITATTIFDHVAKLEERCQEQEILLKRSVDVARFNEVGMTTEEAARFLGMRPSTVRDRVRCGLLERHPKSTDARLLLKASSVLMQTKEGLKTARRRIKYNLK